MTSLINKIEQLIKREKTTPEKHKKDETKKTSSEILSELFGVFNAAPPKIDENSLKKSKKSKKKHKKEKKKRNRSSSCDSGNSDYSHKHKKRKKKSKKRRYSDSPRSPGIATPPLKLPDIKIETIKSEDVKVKKEDKIKTEVKANETTNFPIKHEEIPFIPIDVSDIPMPDSPNENDKCSVQENDKGKGKIQIKNLKFSTVFEETVKQAEEAARKKAEMYEEGEYTDSSSLSDKEESSNSQFPKSSDFGIISKKITEDESKG